LKEVKRVLRKGKDLGREKDINNKYDNYYMMIAFELLIIQLLRSLILKLWFDLQLNWNNSNVIND
jgi:hypothetical protein